MESPRNRDKKRERGAIVWRSRMRSLRRRRRKVAELGLEGPWGERGRERKREGRGLMTRKMERCGGQTIT